MFVTSRARMASLLLALNFTLTLVACALTPQKLEPPSKVAPITIGIIPYENPESLRESAEDMARLLEAKIGAPVKIYVSKDYSGLVDAMREKKIDFAFFSAMTFVNAEKTAGAKVLLKKVWDSPFYYATILTRSDSKITKLSQLKGKTFAYVDKKSASGFLYPQVHFKQEHIDPATYFSSTIFSGNHEESVKLLIEKKVDAIAVYSNDEKVRDSAWNKFAPRRTQVSPRVLWVSAPIPNDPFCVRQDFYDSHPKIAHDLMFALLELDDDAKVGARFKKSIGITSLMFATSQQYEPVRELVKELDLKLE